MLKKVFCGSFLNRGSLSGRGQVYGLCFLATAVAPAVMAAGAVVNVDYSINLSPTHPIVDAYYVGNVAYEDEGNLFYSTSSPVTVTKIANSVPANGTLSASGSTPLNIPDYVLGDLVNGVPEQYYFATGMIVALYLPDPAQPTNYGVALSYNSYNADQVISNENDPTDYPGYDATWNGTVIPSTSQGVDIGVSEADAITALLTGDTSTLAAIETGAAGAQEPNFILTNLMYDPTVTLLDFSSATEGGTGSIEQIVAVPEPTTAGLLGMLAIGALGKRGRRTPATPETACG